MHQQALLTPLRERSANRSAQPDDVTGEVHIELSQVGMAFTDRKGDSRSILQEISLTVTRGEFVCIIGPSGCGKSTLLAIVGGYQAPTHGTARVSGRPVTGPDPRCVFVFQESGVFPWLTVEQNVQLGLMRKSRSERAEISRHYIETVGLSGFEASYPRELSGGMRQRVELARALAAGPEIIYMDEPLGALDFLTRMQMRQELASLCAREEKTVLFVTHDIDEAVQLADRVVVLSPRPGRVTAMVPIACRRPRDIDSPEYIAVRRQLFDLLGASPGEAGVETHRALQGGAAAAP